MIAYRDPVTAKGARTSGSALIVSPDNNGEHGANITAATSWDSQSSSVAQTSVPQTSSSPQKSYADIFDVILMLTVPSRAQQVEKMRTLGMQRLRSNRCVLSIL